MHTRGLPILAAIIAALACLPAQAAGTDEPPPAPKPKPKPAPDDKKALPVGASAEYGRAKAAVDARDWNTALTLLEQLAARDVRDANVQNYLGYVKRHSGRWEEAIGHYRSALVLNPAHRGANEYLGEAYLARGNLALAQVQLGRLQSICGRGCEEYAKLAQAIEEHRRAPR
ncbi:MAG: tetratricopeptide repeat protein [Burkholderiales bacterium]|nr:tetratricopeptide repeat protein [Burkholderiales bacterium]